MWIFWRGGGVVQPQKLFLTMRPESFGTSVSFAEGPKWLQTFRVLSSVRTGGRRFPTLAWFSGSVC